MLWLTKKKGWRRIKWEVSHRYHASRLNVDYVYVYGYRDNLKKWQEALLFRERMKKEKLIEIKNRLVVQKYSQIEYLWLEIRLLRAEKDTMMREVLNEIRRNVYKTQIKD